MRPNNMPYKTLTIPLSKELHELIKSASDKDSRSMSSWIKLVLAEEAKKQLND
jgi:predicted HicB family RNase H-like nuclease